MPPKDDPAEPKRNSVEQDEKDKRNSDVVAPGEEDVEDRKSLRYEQSALAMASSPSLVKREKWGSQTQFLMSCIASAVGLGNVWRFPAICAKYGGASFFIPYIIVLFVVARPIFLMELALGQFSSKGSVRCWDLSPIFTGIGYCGSVSSVLLSTFYILLMAWALIYSCLSFVSMCRGDVYWEGNASSFFGNEVLRSIAFNDEMYNAKFESWVPICHLVLALLISWLIIWGTMVGGVEASGKVAYVTALAPYVVLIILVCSGFCLEGSMLGMEYLFVPDWSQMLKMKTWFEAVGQSFFSLGIGFGGLIMFSSFNEFHHDIFQDVIIISFVDFFTSILAGVSLMTILGFQATQTFEKFNHTELQMLEADCTVDPKADKVKWLKLCTLRKLVADGGAGVAFVQYPAAMYEINNHWGRHLGGFLALLFFLMLILLAVGSANGFVGTTVTILSDQRPDWKRSSVVTGVCMMSFCIGLMYTNRFGSDWIDVIDTHGVTIVVFVLGFTEGIAIVCVYGLKNFCDDMEFLRKGKKVGWYFRITWALLPIILFAVYIIWLVHEYKAAKTWTTAVTVLGWMITTGCYLIIPAVAVLKFLKFRKHPWRRHVPKDFISTLIAISKPSPRWGPCNPEIRQAWKKFKSERKSNFNLIGRIRNTWNKTFSRLTGRPYQEQNVEPSTSAISYATYATASHIPPGSGSGSENAASPIDSGSNVASDAASKNNMV